MNGERKDEFSARVPFKTVLLSILGLWLAYFLLTTLRAEMLDLGFAMEMMWRRAIACAAGVVITLALWLVLRIFDERPLWAKIAAALLVSLPVAVAIAQTNQIIMADLEKRVYERMKAQKAESVGGNIFAELPDMGADEKPTDEPTSITLATAWQDITEVAFGRYFMLLAWCALYLALLTGERATAAERREGEYRRAAKAAELRSLRYQVNPHFLFNTLNSLSALVLTGKTQAAERMIQMISTFYRRSLADDPTSEVPLKEEFALQKLYLEIEAVRFPHRLRAVYQLPPELEDTRVPGMILQPLVENSVKHAVAPTSGQVTITLAAREEYGRLVITVSDDGPGAAINSKPGNNHSIGLANVRDRLEARFGTEATVATGATPEGYTTQLRLPILRNLEG
ncbi:sensor histidine kinase [Altererythrobacter sp. Root672]|uniref:sensor histidine kinase n=1 Tax=Altererythrobacter sp. Root672 TaxID=1736584 RepID=UPI0006F80249|nr:histidine kinase [Altererythrobacter sp. Root672]KRA81575.1 histidine kinase [Altererythrobacter sp. Root672]